MVRTVVQMIRTMRTTGAAVGIGMQNHVSAYHQRRSEDDEQPVTPVARCGQIERRHIVNCRADEVKVGDVLLDQYQRGFLVMFAETNEDGVLISAWDFNFDKTEASKVEPGFMLRKLDTD